LRWCDKGHFEKLSKSSTPYVCEWCSLKTTQSIIQQLQSEIVSLKLELAEAKALAVRPCTMPQTASSTYAAAASVSPSARLEILQPIEIDVWTEFQLKEYAEYGIHISTPLPNLLKMLYHDFAR
jgi:hypothetical protein